MNYQHRLAMDAAYECGTPKLRDFVEETLRSLSVKLQRMEQQDLSQAVIHSHAWSPLGEDYYRALLAILFEDDIQVECKAVLSKQGCLGLSFGGKIEITAYGTYLERFWTLVHEYAHELLHGTQERQLLSKVAKELQAEAVTYIVSEYFGFRKVSAPVYIAFHKGRAAYIPGSSDPIKRCSLYMITRIGRKVDELREKGVMQCA